MKILQSETIDKLAEKYTTQYIEVDEFGSLIEAITTIKTIIDESINDYWGLIITVAIALISAFGGAWWAGQINYKLQKIQATEKEKNEQHKILLTAWTYLIGDLNAIHAFKPPIMKDWEQGIHTQYPKPHTLIQSFYLNIYFIAINEQKYFFILSNTASLIEQLRMKIEERDKLIEQRIVYQNTAIHNNLLSDNLCGIHNVLNDLFPFLQLSIMCVADYAEAYLGGKDIEVAAIRNYDKNLFPTIESLKGLGFDELISKYYKKYPKLFEVQESPAPQPQKPDTPVP